MLIATRKMHTGGNTMNDFLQCRATKDLCKVASAVIRDEGHVITENTGGYVTAEDMFRLEAFASKHRDQVTWSWVTPQGKIITPVYKEWNGWRYLVRT